MPYASKWSAYLPAGMKMTTARAEFASGKFRAFFAAFNEKADGFEFPDERNHSDHDTVDEL